MLMIVEGPLCLLCETNFRLNFNFGCIRVLLGFRGFGFLGYACQSLFQKTPMVCSISHYSNSKYRIRAFARVLWWFTAHFFLLCWGFLVEGSLCLSNPILNEDFYVHIGHFRPWRSLLMIEPCHVFGDSKWDRCWLIWKFLMSVTKDPLFLECSLSRALSMSYVCNLSNNMVNALSIFSLWVAD